MRELIIEKFEEPNSTFFNGAFVSWEDRMGNYHRENDLPAVIHSNGNRAWYKNGKEHRNFGKPSRISSNGKLKEWWVNGEFIKQSY